MFRQEGGPLPPWTPSPPSAPPLKQVSRGGGGGSLGQPTIFRCGSLYCCVGDSAVGHCHLYPLHSWHDILLTFDEGTFPKGNGFPKICLRLPSLLPRRQNHQPKSAAQSILVESGEHVQEFKVKWSRTKKIYTKPVKA